MNKVYKTREKSQSLLDHPRSTILFEIWLTHQMRNAVGRAMLGDSNTKMGVKCKYPTNEVESDLKQIQKMPMSTE